MTENPADKQPIDVSVIASFARRDGDTIRVVLTVPRLEPAARTWVRFVGDHDAFRRPATTTAVGDEVRLEVSVPAERLPAGTWNLRLRQADGPLRRLETRLLVSDRQPIALLPGPVPRTRMPDHAS